MESNPNNTVQEPVVLSMDEERHKKEASSAMVLGIVGDVLVWYPILGIAGLVLSIIALVKANQNRDFAMRVGIREHGANIAGKWCGIGGIIVGAFLLVVYLAIFAVAALLMFNVLTDVGMFSTFMRF
jgi:hypothetical protein